MYPSKNIKGNSINSIVIEISLEVSNQFMAKLWKWNIPNISMDHMIIGVDKDVEWVKADSGQLNINRFSGS